MSWAAIKINIFNLLHSLWYLKLKQIYYNITHNYKCDINLLLDYVNLTNLFYFMIE